MAARPPIAIAGRTFATAVILRVCDFFKSSLEPTLITNGLGCSKTHENQKSHKL